MDVHTRRLRCFVTLAQELSFTRAANELHVSQQGLSRSIREARGTGRRSTVLAHHANRRAHRGGRRVPRGTRVALATLDASAEAARRAQGRVAEELRVGFVVSSALELTPPIIRAFQDRYPAVTLESRPSTGATPPADYVRAKPTSRSSGSRSTASNCIPSSCSSSRARSELGAPIRSPAREL